jgi:hypothetical protein
MLLMSLGAETSLIDFGRAIRMPPYKLKKTIKTTSFAIS